MTIRDAWSNTRFFVAIPFAIFKDITGGVFTVIANRAEAVVARIDAKYAGALGDVGDTSERL